MPFFAASSVSLADPFFESPSSADMALSIRVLSAFNSETISAMLKFSSRSRGKGWRHSQENVGSEITRSRKGVLARYLSGKLTTRELHPFYSSIGGTEEPD